MEILNNAEMSQPLGAGAPSGGLCRAPSSSLVLALKL